MKDWLRYKEDFEVKDVRKLKDNFLPSIIAKAKKLEIGQGLCIIQDFEPIPLYSAMADLGYAHETHKISDTEYRAYFYRKKIAEPTYPGGMDVPFKPTAIVNYSTIDPRLADQVVHFWDYIWNRQDSAIDMQTRLLLSLANGVGAGRIRQAVREFIKAYTMGVDIRKFDELFAMMAWNQGIGYFSSEIGPSALFAAYKYVKTQEEKNTDRDKIIKGLMDKFGEKNPRVSTFYRNKNT